MLKVEIIELKDLMSFVRSDRFKEFSTKPISLLRAKSYIKNPNALPNDPVMTLGFLGNELVAFRTLWRDKLYSERDEYSFGWCSGNWVHPNHRGRGYSKQLFDIVYQSWEGKLMATNMAPVSRHQYLQSGKMELFHKIEGYRFYRKSVLARILPSRYPKFKWLKPAYRSLDQFLNMGIYPIPNESNTKTINISKQIIPLWKSLTTNHNLVFRRSKVHFEWFWIHPWMTDEPSSQTEQSTYPFSLWSEDYERHLVQVLKGENDKAQVLLLKKNKAIKLCYATNFEEKYECNALLNHILALDFDYITLYDSQLIDFFKRQRKFYLYAKPFSEEFVMSKPLYEQLKGQDLGHIMFGDGDSVFS